MTIASILTIAAAIPYLVEVLRGKAKPRVVSWAVWTSLTGIASAASFSDGQIVSGVFTAAGTLGTLSVVVLGWKYGDRKLERLDFACLAGALAGLALWLILDSPALAVLVTVSIDLIGCIPTIKHSWQKPHEETWITYAVSSVGGGLTLFVIGDWHITSALYPVYITLAAASIALVILLSPHRHTKNGSTRTARTVIYLISRGVAWAHMASKSWRIMALKAGWVISTAICSR